MQKGGKEVVMKKIALLLALMITAFANQGELCHIITPRGGGDPQEANKKIVQQFYDAFRKNDPQAMKSILASNHTVQDANVIFDSSYSRYDAFSKNLIVRLSALHKALPDFTLQVIELLSEGNKVVARVQIQGAQKGPFLGIEPTNKSVVIKEFVIFTIEGGEITHLNEIWNELSVMKQIGAVLL